MRIPLFLKPNLRKVIIFLIFLFIAAAGGSEAWVFSGKDAGIPKPWLYKTLEPFNISFWGISIYLLLPIYLLVSVITPIVHTPNFLITIVAVIYLYFLASIIEYGIQYFIRKRNERSR